MEQFLKTIKNKNTEKTYKNAIENYYTHSGSNALSQEGVKKFLAFCKVSEWGRDTIVLYLTALRSWAVFLREVKSITVEQWFFIKQVIDCFIQSLPCKQRHLFELPSDKDIDKIIDYLSPNSNDKPTPSYTHRLDLISLRNKAIFLVLLSTGLRVSEVAHLSLKDVELTTRTVSTIVKGGKPHTVIISSDALTALARYLRARGYYRLPPGSPLFARHDRSIGLDNEAFLSVRSIQNIFKSIKNDNGIECEFTPHTMRRLFASNEFRKSGNFFRVRDLLGHNAGYDTTEIYIHPDVVNVAEGT